MDFPLTCRECGAENWVDLDKLTRRKAKNKISISEGCECQSCKAWIHFFHTTYSMEAALKKLSKIDISRPTFLYFFAKTLRKAIGLQEKFGG